MIYDLGNILALTSIQYPESSIPHSGRQHPESMLLYKFTSAYQPVDNHPLSGRIAE